jgi:hypothetical protein
MLLKKTCSLICQIYLFQLLQLIHFQEKYYTMNILINFTQPNFKAVMVDNTTVCSVPYGYALQPNMRNTSNWSYFSPTSPQFYTQVFHMLISSHTIFFPIILASTSPTGHFISLLLHCEVMRQSSPDLHHLSFHSSTSQTILNSLSFIYLLLHLTKKLQTYIFQQSFPP